MPANFNYEIEKTLTEHIKIIAKNSFILSMTKIINKQYNKENSLTAARTVVHSRKKNQEKFL